MTKKILALALCVIAVLSVCACKNKETENSDKAGEKVTDVKIAEEEKVTAPSTNSDFRLPEAPADEVAHSAKMLGFENVKLFEAFASAVGKKPVEITGADIDNIHYISIIGDGNGKANLTLGYIDYVDNFLKLHDEGLSETEIRQSITDYEMHADFEFDAQKDTLSDLAKFKHTEMFEIYEIPVKDVSFVKSYDMLFLGYFKNNGITDISPLASYNPIALGELDFTGNNIADWSPLMHIKEKIIVHYEVQTLTDGSGNEVEVPILVSLEEYLEELENESGEDFASDFSSLFD